MTTQQAPLAHDATPGEIRAIEGQYRIALVGFAKPDANGEYESCLRWYLPKTRGDIHAIRRFAQSKLGSNP